MKPLHELTEMDAAEIAGLLNVSVRRIQQLCQKGDLPAERKLFKVWCIDLVALRERYPDEWDRLEKKHSAKIAGRCITCGK